MSDFISLHFDHLRFDDGQFHSSIRDLRETRYSLKAKNIEAPQVTHCVSAVRYIIAKATGMILPPVYIGNCISDYLYSGVFGARIIPLSYHDHGDLVFFHKKSPAYGVYMITHVGIFIDDTGNYFHSSTKGGKIENISASIMRGTLVTCDLALRRTDPRVKA